jgi:hypothetical protein
VRAEFHNRHDYGTAAFVSNIGPQRRIKAIVPRAHIKPEMRSETIRQGVIEFVRIVSEGMEKRGARSARS